MLLSRILPATARAAPGALCITCGSQTFSYAEMLCRVSRLAGALLTMGVQPGQRVGIIGRLCHHDVETEVAAIAVGAIPFGINPAHMSAQGRV